MGVFARFLGFQVIGWCVVASVLYAGVAWLEIVSGSFAWLLFALFVAKDFALYPLTRRAYEHGPAHGAADLIGSEVRVLEVLDPQREGYVVAGGERWRARLAPGWGVSLEPGRRARVRALDGITLVVEPVGTAVVEVAGPRANG